MSEPEVDPKIKLALELAEHNAVPDYPDYRKGVLGAVAGAVLFTLGTLVVSLLLTLIRNNVDAGSGGMPLWSIIGMAVLGAFLGGTYFALRPPIGR